MNLLKVHVRVVKTGGVTIDKKKIIKMEKRSSKIGVKRCAESYTQTVEIKKTVRDKVIQVGEYLRFQ